MFYIIDNLEQIQKLIDKNYQNAFIHVIDNNYYHPKLNEILLIYYRPLDSKNGFICGLKHQDVFSMPMVKIKELVEKTPNLYGFNKKNLLYYFKDLKIFDLDLITNSDVSLEDSYTKFHKNNVLNTIIPVVKHFEFCEKLFDSVKEHITSFKKSKSFEFYNDVVIPQLFEVEQNGLKINLEEFKQHYNVSNPEYSINIDRIYSQYNTFTTTSRPSNSFNNISFAALNKDDGTKKSFICENDYLIEYDYDAYHLRLLAYIVGYNFTEISVHTELGKYYFNKSELTDEDYKKSKQLSFKQLYGGIDKKYLHIPFFKSVQHLTDQMWKLYTNGEDIIVPISEKIFNKTLYPDLNPSKLLNYFVQAFETSRNICKIQEINSFLKDKKSKMVLYTYDSFVLDVCKEENIEPHILNILQDKHFLVKTKSGKNLDFK